MVYVRLEQEWTDPDGTTHAAGTTVDVDAGTLATLEAQGVVAESGEQSGGDADKPAGDSTSGWIGPTGGSTSGWIGPTGQPGS